VSGVWDPLRPELDTEPPLDPPVPRASYEDLCSDHAREIRRVLAALVPRADEVEVPAADSRRQADATSHAMARRFTEERRRRKRLARGPARVLRLVMPRAH
jgi:hypothetical protein